MRKEMREMSEMRGGLCCVGTLIYVVGGSGGK